MTRLRELNNLLLERNASPDISQALELEELSRSVPKLISILPDVLCNHSDPRHNAALVEMISGMMRQLDLVRPLALVCLHFGRYVNLALTTAGVTVAIPSSANVGWWNCEVASYTFGRL